MIARRLRLFCLLGVFAGILSAQRPVIRPSGIVNGASFASPANPGGWVAPGSIAAIFGENLSPVTEVAHGLPVPFELAGVSVTFDGLPAPIFYASPGQLNVQVPSGLFGIGQRGVKAVDVVITTPGGASEPVQVAVVDRALGIFTRAGSGCGQGTILNARSDGALEFNGPEASVQPGDWITVFFTGLGITYNMPADGQPAGDALSPTEASYFLGTKDFDQWKGRFTFTGKAPGTVGVDQVNIQIPKDAPEGCRVPLRLGFRSLSQPVPLSIHRGRGACVPAPVSLGVIEWSKTFYPNSDTLQPQEMLKVRLNKGDANSFPAPPPRPPAALLNASGTPEGPKCEEMLPDPLDAGALVAQTPAGPLPDIPSPADPGGVAVIRLPDGTIGQGAYRIEATGGRDVGGFASDITIPAPIQFTTVFPEGMALSCSGFEVRWTGGDNSSIVRVNVRQLGDRTVEPETIAVALASDGHLSVGLAWPLPGGGWGPAPWCGRPAELIITQEPLPEAVATFRASGLSLPGRHTWKYEFRFGTYPTAPIPKQQ